MMLGQPNAAVREVRKVIVEAEPKGSCDPAFLIDQDAMMGFLVPCVR